MGRGDRFDASCSCFIKASRRERTGGWLQGYGFRKGCENPNPKPARITKHQSACKEKQSRALSTPRVLWANWVNSLQRKQLRAFVLLCDDLFKQGQHFGICGRHIAALGRIAF